MSSKPAAGRNMKKRNRNIPQKAAKVHPRRIWWEIRGKTIEELMQELRTFSDQKAKIWISIDGGDTLYPISLLGNFNTTEGRIPGMVFFPGDDLLIYKFKGRSPAAINIERWPVMKPKVHRSKASPVDKKRTQSIKTIR